MLPCRTGTLQCLSCINSVLWRLQKNRQGNVWVPTMRKQSDSQQRVSVILTRDFLPVSGSVLGSHLPGLLDQATTPGLLTPYCDFSTAGFARDSAEVEAGTTLSTKEQQTACSLPTSMLCCLLCVPSLSHLQPPSPAVRNLLSSQKASPNRFSPFILALCVSSLHQLLFTTSHSTSCRHFSLPPPAPLLQEVDASGSAMQFLLSSYSQN